MQDNHYVYAYMRNDGTPYYIGRGIKNRAWRKHKAVKTPDDKSKIVILESNLSPEDSITIEKKFINFYGKAKDGGYLANVRDDVYGLWFYGKTHDAETIEKIKNNPKTGRPRIYKNNAEKQRAYRKKKKELKVALA